MKRPMTVDDSLNTNKRVKVDHTLSTMSDLPTDVSIFWSFEQLHVLVYIKQIAGLDFDLQTSISISKTPYDDSL